MLLGAYDGLRRRWGLIAALSSAIALGACSAIGSITSMSSTDILPTQDDVVATNFQSYDAVEVAYGNVVAGQTRLPDLASLGFDAANAPNVEKLSYLGVMDRFMPGSSLRFDKLAPAVQGCIEAQEHCSAFVFRPARIHEARTGNFILDMLGFERLTVEAGWSAEVIFLMQDGRVVYKVLQGKPNIQEVHDRISPLGPLQDIGGTALGFGTRAVKL